MTATLSKDLNVTIKRKHATNDARFLEHYFSQYRKALEEMDVSRQLVELKDMMVHAERIDKKVIIVGNGGSAAIASHCSIDLNKVAGIRCMTFNEASLITCLANDYGYESWVAKALEFHAQKEDVVVLISSSGKSPNMIRGAEYARRLGAKLVTFTVFSKNNPLKVLGHINFWMNSKDYNMIECFHQLWLLSVCDLIAETRQERIQPSLRALPNTHPVSPTVPTAA